MRLCDLLVQLDSSPQSDRRIELACRLAAEHDAHLVGLYPLNMLSWDIYDWPDRAAAAALIEQARSRALKDAASAQQRFEARAQIDGVTSEWRLVEGLAREATTIHARYADLAILGQEDPNSPAPQGVIADVLFGSGRPILVTPQAGSFETIGRNILVGWNAGREAVRVVNDAFPLLAKAEKVTVLSVNPKRDLSSVADVPASDLAVHLARHGLSVSVAHTFAEHVSEAEALIGFAANIGADLLVVGGYGHLRFREVVLGGLTRDVLRSMRFPVLMSH